MTKLHIYIFTLLSLLCSCKSNKINKDNTTKTYHSNGLTTIAVNKKIHDFGEIKKGEIVACIFYVENKGENALIIKNIEASCGCATFNWNKKPIPPGDKTKLEVEFNSEGRYGKQFKVISIFANIPEKVKDIAVTAVIR